RDRAGALGALSLRRCGGGRRRRGRCLGGWSRALIAALRAGLVLVCRRAGERLASTRRSRALGHEGGAHVMARAVGEGERRCHEDDRRAGGEAGEEIPRAAAAENRGAGAAEDG